MEIDPHDVGAIGHELKRHNTSDNDSLEGTSYSHKGLSSHGSDSLEAATEAEVSAYHVTKWKRLRKQFNDQYLDLFNNVSKESLSAVKLNDLPSSQLGAVSWTSSEKENLFVAIERFGRHDLARLSTAIATKSPVEIRAYLDAVHTAHIERQLFMSHPRNASRADVSAAVEIGHPCEIVLDGAADALSAYQEQYDITAGQEQYGRSWVIDRDVALQFDAESDDAQAQSDGNVDETDQRVVEISRVDAISKTNGFFNLSTMLDLSEQFFMNRSPESSYPHWTNISEPNQRPALTQDTLDTLLQLVADRVKEVIKITLHMAKSRLSSMASGGYEPTQSLGRSDVCTALDVLNHPHDSWEFWTNLPRRNHFQVVTGSHSKGETRMKTISHDAAEAALAIRRNRGKRRSMSIGSETSSVQSDISEDAGTLSAFEEKAADESSEESSEFEDNASDREEHIDDVASKRSRSASLSSSESLNTSDVNGARSPINRAERKVLLDDALEDYMEKADELAKMEEEERLWQIFGKRARADIEDEYKLGPRPKTMRKTREELQDWSCNYLAEWEHSVGLHAPVENADNGRNKETDIEHSE